MSVRWFAALLEGVLLRRVPQAMPALALALVVNPLKAQASGREAPGIVQLATLACGNSEQALAFVSALSVELETRPIPEQHVATFAVCDIASGHVELSMAGRNAQIDVSDVPQLARPRTAAVAVAETLRWWSSADSVHDESRSRSTIRDAPTDHVPIYPAPIVEPRPVEHEPPPPPSPSADSSRAAAGVDALDLSLGTRWLVMGPERTLLWGPDLRFGWCPFGFARVEAGVGYIRGVDTSVLGDAELHALSYRLSIEVAFAQAPQWPSALQAHVGVGLEGLSVTTVASSQFGFDERGADAWVLLLDVHGTIVAALHEHWRLSLSGSAYKDVVGAHLQAGGKEGFTLFGLGGGLRLGMGREF